MTSFNEPERNLAAEAREREEREERENHPTATRSRSPGGYGDCNMTSDMGHESPWKPVSELLLDHDALVATVVVVRRKKAYQVRLAVALAYHTVSNTWRTESWVDPVREFEEYMVIPK